MVFPIKLFAIVNTEHIKYLDDNFLTFTIFPFGFALIQREKASYPLQFLLLYFTAISPAFITHPFFLFKIDLSQFCIAIAEIKWTDNSKFEIQHISNHYSNCSNPSICWYWSFFVGKISLFVTFVLLSYTSPHVTWILLWFFFLALQVTLSSIISWLVCNC